MIKLTTNCAECSHERVCQYKHNARNAMDKLRKITYGCGPNEDFNWEIMTQHKHVDITFSCPSFDRKKEFGIRGV